MHETIKVAAGQYSAVGRGTQRTSEARRSHECQRQPMSSPVAPLLHHSLLPLCTKDASCAQADVRALLQISAPVAELFNIFYRQNIFYTVDPLAHSDALRRQTRSLLGKNGRKRQPSCVPDASGKLLCECFHCGGKIIICIIWGRKQRRGIISGVGDHLTVGERASTGDALHERDQKLKASFVLVLNLCKVQCPIR
jgi:hypothetical protein